MDDLASCSGWLGAALIVAAALVPLSHRAFMRLRAAPTSRTITGHVVLGLAVIGHQGEEAIVRDIKLFIKY